jgi:hypothetical protein
VKLAAASQFDMLENGQNVRRENLQKYLYKKINIPTSPVQKDKFPVEVLRERLKGWIHELNWLRKKHGEIIAE